MILRKKIRKKGATQSLQRLQYIFFQLWWACLSSWQEKMCYGHYIDSSLSEGLQIIGFLSRDTSTRIEIRVKNRIGYLIFVKGPRLLRFFSLASLFTRKQNMKSKVHACYQLDFLNMDHWQHCLLRWGKLINSGLFISLSLSFRGWLQKHQHVT